MSLRGFAGGLTMFVIEAAIVASLATAALIVSYLLITIL